MYNKIVLHRSRYIDLYRRKMREEIRADFVFSEEFRRTRIFNTTRTCYLLKDVNDCSFDLFNAANRIFYNTYIK